jgi:hypothetical protein
VYEDRRVRLPPLAKLQVEEASTTLEQALVAGRRAMSQLTTNPAGAALDLAQQIDLTHQANSEAQKACSGVPGVEEERERPVLRTPTVLEDKSMTPNTTILPRNQKPNTTAVTREKGRRLTVLDITAREAVVEGDTNDYTVIFRGLSCSCDAGRAGLHCSHVQSALIERAHMTGYENVMFAHNQDHADAFAAMQRATGKRADLGL